MLSNKNNSELFGFTFFEAVKKNQYELVKKLLASGVNPNSYIDADGNTALHAAVEINSPYMIALLLRHGAATNKKNTKNTSKPILGEVEPCLYAARKAHWQCVLAFAYEKKNDNRSGYSIVLTLAVNENLFDVAEALLKAGANPNLGRMLSEADYALHLAARYKNKFMFTLLLNYKADPALKNLAQENPYDLATKLHGPEFIESILDAQKISMADIKLIIFTLLLATTEEFDKTKPFSYLPAEILLLILRYTFNDLSDNWVTMQNQFYMNSIRAFYHHVENTSPGGFFTTQKSPLQTLATTLNITSRENCSVSDRAKIAKEQINAHYNNLIDVKIFERDTNLLMKFHLFSPDYLQLITKFCKHLQKKIDTFGEKKMQSDRPQLFGLQQALLEILGDKNYHLCGKAKMAEAAIKEFLDTHIDISTDEFVLLKAFNLLPKNAIEEMPTSKRRSGLI